MLLCAKRIMSTEEKIVMNGGYGVPYDPRPALDRLSSSPEDAITELWENLYHQGDVGEASYFAVPALVEAGELSLVGAIEVARKNSRNPAIPQNLQKNYSAALEKALIANPKSEEQFQGYYVIHAALHGQHRLAKALNLLSVEEIISEYG